ncbi:MAG TPA: hypothetical protein VFP05_07880 [Thermomicrobiales bacterium]|nr:hypothetical protein [Thermomicrobiales bacterium]
MGRRRLLALLLAVSLLPTGLLAVPGALAGPAPAPAVRYIAHQSTECVQLAWYAGTMHAWGESVDDEESGADSDNLETWTAADYDHAIALYDDYLAQLDRITPPPAAAAFHQTIRDGVALYQRALETMKTAGPFAILAYLDQFDQLTKQAGEQALVLEAECGIALYDNDDDGVPEVGPGVATPAPTDDSPLTDVIPATEVAPVATALDGRPIMPIGTTVQTSDAFSLTIVSVDQNAVDAVPETPPAGYQYVNVEITLGHLRDQTDTFDLISLVALGPGGSVYSAVGNSCGFVDGPLAPGDYTGTMTMTGHVCFVVNSRDVAGLALYDQTQPPDQRVYLSLDPSAG